MTVAGSGFSPVMSPTRDAPRAAILLVCVLASLHLGASAFDQTCLKGRSIEGKKAYLRSSQPVQLGSSTEPCPLQEDTTYRVTKRNESFILSTQTDMLWDRVCTIDGAVLKVPEGIFISCLLKKEKAEEDILAQQEASERTTEKEVLVSGLSRKDATDTLEPSLDMIDHLTQPSVFLSEEESTVLPMTPTSVLDTVPPPTEDVMSTVFEPRSEVQLTTTSPTPHSEENTTSLYTEEIAPSATFALPPEVLSTALPTTPIPEETTVVMETEELAPSPTSAPPIAVLPSTTKPEPTEAVARTPSLGLPIITKLETTTVFPKQRVPLSPSEIVVSTTLEIVPTTSPTIVPTSTVPPPTATATVLPIQPESSTEPATPGTEKTVTENVTADTVQEQTPNPVRPTDILSEYLYYIAGGAAGILLLIILVIVLVCVSKKKKKKSERAAPALGAGRADYVRQQDAFESPEHSNVNIMMYAADEPLQQVELDNIFDSQSDESSVPVMPKCLQDENFE